MRKIVETVLPVTMVGSHPRPLWFKHQLHGQDIQAAFKLEEHAQAFSDAVGCVMRDQEHAGLDIVTDGQMHFDDYGGSIGSFDWYWYERLPGFYPNKMRNPLAGDASLGTAEVLNNWGGTITTGKIERGPIRLADLYRIATEHTGKPIKVSVGAGPLDLGLQINYDAPESYYKNRWELADDLIPVFNAEMKELVEAGATFLQLEDLGAWLVVDDEKNAPLVVDVVNRLIDGVDAKIAWHFCLGTAYGNTFRAFEGLLEKILPPLYDTRVEQFVLDFALREMRDIAVLSTLPSDKEVAAGVIDVRGLRIETEEEVAERMRKVLEIVPAERVYFTTDCGMRVLPRIVAKQKLIALAKAARTVRSELGTAAGD